MNIKTLLITFLFLCIALLPIAYVVAEDDSSEETTSQDEIEELQEKEDEYADKVNELQGKAQTLSNEIQSVDAQINLTEARIQSSVAKISKTETDIKKLTGDIDDLKHRIVKLQDAIVYQKEILNSRFREQYKIGETSPLVMLLGSDTFGAIINKAKYLEIMEYQDKKLMSEMEEVKTVFNTQKGLFEEKKQEEEDLKKQLEVEKRNLDANKGTLLQQQAEKKRLLDVTQNDEAKYQELLAEVRKELQQITNAVSVLKNQKAKEVKKGEIIGIQGNTGYSSGEHLHFGVYRYSSFEDIDGWNWYYSNYVDPSKVLKSKDVYWDAECNSGASYKKVGKGDWNWPISNPTVSQGFGHTCWSNIYYGGKDHPAYDMYGTSGAPVFAAEDGEAYFCRNCLGDGGNGVFIFHDDNYMSLYWHLR